MHSFFGGINFLIAQFVEQCNPTFTWGDGALLERVDLAGTCAKKSVFLLLARSSTEGGATQLSLRLGPPDRPVNHEKAGECQHFSSIFSLFFFFCFIYFFFFTIISIEPSRLCRHPSIRTLS